MTAVEWLSKKTFIPVYLLEQAKEMEKQQIIDAYIISDDNPIDTDLYRTLQKNDAEQYYNDTYGSKGTDERKINLVEIPQEQLEKERNPNYKYFDIDDNTSSQTEISDEDIEKASIGNATFAPSFINGAKWYREQLRNKQ